MYPAELLSLFPPFPRDNTVFVAMSFDARFDSLWRNVLIPAAKDVDYQGTPLEAHRVDLTRKSDAILTEIVERISRSRLILADITSIGSVLVGWHKHRPIRNSNVLYEVGIAHAARLPEEVILVRGDDDPLDFDISGVRVHRYSQNPNEARRQVATLLADALKAVDARRHLSVRLAVQSLDLTMYLLLDEAMTDVKHPKTSTMREVLSSIERIAAINRLLSAGLLQASLKKMTPEMFDAPVEETLAYRATPFGREVFAAARHEAGFFEAFKGWLQTESGRRWLDEQIRNARPVESEQPDMLL